MVRSTQSTKNSKHNFKSTCSYDKQVQFIEESSNSQTEISIRTHPTDLA